MTKPGVIKRLWSSMVTQMVLVVLLALVIAQAFSFVILGNAYRTVLSDINQKSQFQQIESLVWLLENNPVDDYPAILAAARTKNTWFTVDDYIEMTDTVLPFSMNVQDKRRMQRLLHLMGDPYKGRIFVKVDHSSGSGEKNSDKKSTESDRWKNIRSCNEGDNCQKPWHRQMVESGHDGEGRYYREGWRPPVVTSLQVSVHMLNGYWLNLKARAPVAPPLAAKQTVIFLVTAMVLVLLALAVMVRRITRPLRMLSKASVRLGMGEKVEPLPETGPADLRETIRAFNQMNDRLQRFVSDRTRMLAALSHDLRTPITSMRLRVELMPESHDRDRLLETLEEMQQMSEATLAFMRQASDNEVTRQVDLNAMLGSLCDDLAEIGQAVNFQETSETIIRCRPVSLKRALRNLIENGVKYGQSVDVSLALYDQNGAEKPGQHVVSVIIRDCGPGIPEAMMEQVFEPFFRLEGSRNRDTGG
ncbi:ATP-binding protein, partial [Endozoicomonas sp.]|uniref:ATP-binding protein n=1 Tax=Endozoicomonas sp. TaxID=1892382 RepID=UPI00383AF712